MMRIDKQFVRWGDRGMHLEVNVRLKHEKTIIFEFLDSEIEGLANAIKRRINTITSDGRCAHSARVDDLTLRISFTNETDKLMHHYRNWCWITYNPYREGTEKAYRVMGNVNEYEVRKFAEKVITIAFNNKPLVID